MKSSLRLLLIDHDRVEPHNLKRQNFFEGEVGKFKSQALAERLSRQYGRRVAYTVLPYERDTLNDVFHDQHMSTIISGIVVGCVDNAQARREIALSIDWGRWWLDAGNGEHSGQILIGNVTKPEEMTDAFDEKVHLVDKLPAPSLQLPALLMPPTVTVKREQDCAEAVEDNTQSPVINQAMASQILNVLYKLLTGTLTWMGVYLDLDAGTLTPVPAEPITVARMLSVKVDTLMAHNEACSRGIFRAPRARVRV